MSAIDLRDQVTCPGSLLNCSIVSQIKNIIIFTVCSKKVGYRCILCRSGARDYARIGPAVFTILKCCLC